MRKKPKILAFAGSLRKDSFNKKLIKIAMNGASLAGADVTYIDLLDYPMPVYDGDIESEKGLPENAIKLKDLMAEHDGFLISSPEYNSSISGALKNFIDWTSRKKEASEKNLNSFNGKIAGLVSASPGQLGGLRGLVHLRAILENINVMVIPQQKCISVANDAFTVNGTLKDSQQQVAVENVGKFLAELLIKLHH